MFDLLVCLNSLVAKFLVSEAVRGRWFSSQTPFKNLITNVDLQKTGPSSMAPVVQECRCQQSIGNFLTFWVLLCSTLPPPLRVVALMRHRWWWNFCYKHIFDDNEENYQTSFPLTSWIQDLNLEKQIQVFTHIAQFSYLWYHSHVQVPLLIFLIFSLLFSNVILKCYS